MSTYRSQRGTCHPSIAWRLLLCGTVSSLGLWLLGGSSLRAMAQATGQPTDQRTGLDQPGLEDLLRLELLPGGVAQLPPSLSSPSFGAARLQQWRFDPERNRLEITTQGAVRPRLFTLENPQRVVVDLPNTFLPVPERTESFSGSVQSIRVSQFDPQTVRIVLDLRVGVSMTLADLELQTANDQLWAVQLPARPSLFTVGQGVGGSLPPLPTGAGGLTQPNASVNNSSTNAAGYVESGFLPPETPTAQVPAFGAPPPASNPENPNRLTFPVNPAQAAPPPLGQPSRPPVANPFPSTPPPPNTSPFSGAPVKITGISPSGDGFLIRTTGPALVTTRRLIGPDRVVVDVLNSDVSQISGPKEFSVNRLGVASIRVGQFEPTVSRVVLDVDATSSDWETIYDPQSGGIRLYPAGGAGSASLLPDAPADFAGPVATIQAVQLSGSKLTITADGFLFYRSGWDPETNGYRISVTPARLPDSMPDPGLSDNSPVERIRFRQETPQTVSILVQPAREFSVREEAPGQGTRRIALDLIPADGQPFPEPELPMGNVPIGSVMVALDPGHGGRDPGAIGVGGVQEKQVNLAIAQRVSAILREQGISTLMTRTDDREILLQPRVDQAVAAQATIFVSIHTNALGRADVQGIETYYLRPDSARLAQTMHRAIVGGTGAVDRGVRTARFFVVRETPTTMPSVLLELGYLTHPGEGSRLATPAYQEQVAQAVAAGIRAYLQGQ